MCNEFPAIDMTHTSPEYVLTSSLSFVSTHIVIKQIILKTKIMPPYPLMKESACNFTADSEVICPSNTQNVIQKTHKGATANVLSL